MKKKHDSRKYQHWKQYGAIVWRQCNKLLKEMKKYESLYALKWKIT